MTVFLGLIAIICGATLFLPEFVADLPRSSELGQIGLIIGATLSLFGIGLINAVEKVVESLNSS